MGNMLQRAKSILHTNEFTAVFDKGYHTGSELKIAQELGINAIVAIPDVASNSPDIRFNMANFQYNKEDDTYTCPEHHVLITNGNWYSKKSGAHRSRIRVKHYKTKACKDCPVFNLCTSNTRSKGRVIERSEYAQYIEQNRVNVENNKDAYKQRQAIVEHPYGTIKRQWGFSYILTKQGKARASADVGFMFIAYNLRRIMNIMGIDAFRNYLKTLAFLFSHLITLVKAKISHFKLSFFSKNYLLYYFYHCSNRLIFDEILMLN
jgi:hypothetical protein